jgi:serine/threonine-protein kinase PpkA
MIEIPGYRILRQLGRGGMATVYLALQESVQREVALKVMAPTLVGEEFGERFLREARIAASLRHPHVVQVHDVGRSDGLHYIAMEYLAGGPVLRRERLHDIGYALRITREIADALDYAHGRGVIHRDIKPDNLLLRDDGAVVLTDFGIARAGDASRMTQAGMIMGTPHYMAPEQATGERIDGRADLYALGIMFHELLLGRVPFDADDWVAVGLMHLSAPVPELPGAFAELQPLLEKMLAKKPEQRFQSGAELVAAIEEVEDRLIARGVIEAVRTPGRPRTPPLRPSDPRVQQAASEPVLGRLDAIADRPSPRPRRALSKAGRAQRGRRLGLLVALLLLSVLAAGYHFQAPLRELWPQTRYETVLENADQALRQGRLSAADGSGARELYQHALALNPDDSRARDGLLAVGEAFLAEASGALDESRIDDARRALAIAREIGVAGSRIDALQQQLQQGQQRDDELEAAVRAARAAFDEGRLDGSDDAALTLYQQALQIDPDSQVARHGLRQTLSRLLERASAAIDAGDLDDGERQIEAIAAIDPFHVELGPQRTRLAEARQARRGALQTRLDDAAALLQRGRLILPAGDNARDAYRAILAEAPGNADAESGLRRVADALLAQAERATADFDFERARALIAEARSTLPGHPGPARAERRLAELESRSARLAVSSQADPAQLARDLDAAAAAVREGRLVHPPGESAFDLYRSVQRADPGNVAATAGIASLPAAARRHFEQALAGNRFNAAYGYVQGLETLAPTDPALADMRGRLARSLLGFADERLGAGEVERARDAVMLAAELDPASETLPAMRARLEQMPR